MTLREFLAESIDNKVLYSTFVRWGGLSSVNQRGYDSSMPTAHHPPARRGIYAFPIKATEPYLLGANFDPRRMEIIKGSDGKRLDQDHPEWDEYGKDESRRTTVIKDKWVAIRHSNYRKFRYEGDIWCHFDPKPSEIIKENGGWNLVSNQTYRRLLHATLGADLIRKRKTQAIPSKDFYEVFIEKV